MGGGREIPEGWHLCDGTSGTPDLRDRFVVGAGNTYSTGDTGGADEVTLTTEQMPSHTHVVTDPGHSHSMSFTTAAGRGDLARVTAFNSDGSDQYTQTFDTTNTETNVTISRTGSGRAHENRPPYYALAFIMKL